MPNIQYKNQPAETFVAYFTGTDTLDVGYALCYDADYGTAADQAEDRNFRVEKPSTTNCRWFAGVVAVKPDGAGPCYVHLVKPGSVFEVYAKANCTIDSTRMTVMAGQYYLGKAGFPGTGSAIALQTVDRSTTPGLVQAQLESGPQSGGVEEITPPTTGATGNTMTTGVTYLVGTVTIGTGDHVLTQANGSAVGQKKAIVCEGTYTTNDVVVSVTNHATSDPETFEYDAAAEETLFVWMGSQWHTVVNTATVT